VAYAPQPVAYAPEPAAYAPQPVTYAPAEPVASAPAYSPQPAEPAALVPYTPAAVVVTTTASAEVVRFDAAASESTFPWEASIAALEAEQQARASVAPQETRRSREARAPREAREPRAPRASQALVVVAPQQATYEQTESATTPWIWLLAFSPVIAVAIAGALEFFVAPILAASAGLDASTTGLAIGAVSLLPIWLIAGLDISALRRRGFTPPSVLWILLLTPLAYFLARGRAVSREGASARGPWITYLVNVLAVLAAGAAAVVLMLPLITAAGLNPFSPKVEFDPPATSAPLYQYGIGVQTPQANKAGVLPGGDEALWQQVSTVLKASWLDANGGYIDCSSSEKIIALGSTFPCFAEKFDAKQEPTGAVTLNVTVDKAGAVSYTEVPGDDGKA